MADKLKLLIAFLILAAGVFAFSYFDQWLQVARVGLILTTVAVAIAVAATSTQGKEAIKFASKAKSEGQKVVWPARPEATQITLIVLAGAIIASLFIWMADSILFKVVYGLILGA
ncbi:MAG: preprotein translocase subunit SecE [Proteobacteria bacterium]|nr:preprotein translocase subunit SecE [Pseudomonadota bacterium]